MPRWDNEWEDSKWLINKTSKGAVKDGGDGDEMKMSKWRVWWSSHQQKEWMCLSGDESQHSRHRDGCRARSRSSTSPTDERYNAKIDSMQITSKAQMIPHQKKLKWADPSCYSLEWVECSLDGRDGLTGFGGSTRAFHFENNESVKVLSLLTSNRGLGL